MTEKTTEEQHQAMVKDLAKDGQQTLNEISPKQMHMLHMAVGVCGEVGELIEPLASLLITDEFDRVNAVEELGDIEFYLEGLREALEIEYIDTDLIRLSLFELYKCTRDICLSLPIEAANLLDAVKKETIYQKDTSDIIKASLRVMRYNLTLVYEITSIHREEALEANLHKLLKGDKARYKSGTFSNKAAQERADKKK